MGELLHHPALADVPFIIETPGAPVRGRRHIATLKALRDDGPAVVSALALIPRGIRRGEGQRRRGGPGHRRGPR